jgi:hypothetical protein
VPAGYFGDSRRSRRDGGASSVPDRPEPSVNATPLIASNPRVRHSNNTRKLNAVCAATNGRKRPILAVCFPVWAKNSILLKTRVFSRPV